MLKQYWLHLCNSGYCCNNVFFSPVNMVTITFLGFTVLTVGRNVWEE